MPSKSKEKFDERIKEIIIIQEMRQGITLKESSEERNQENAINRASIVMLCSHVEGYMEDILEEFIGSIRESGVDCKRIPTILKVMLCKPGLKSLNNSDQNVLARRIPDFIKNYEAIWWSEEKMDSERFPEFIRRDWQIGNPWPDVILTYLEKIGIGDFWDDSNRTLKGDLQTLVDKRNLIAHGHFEATATRDDVNRYVESAKKLVDFLDVRIERHLDDLNR